MECLFSVLLQSINIPCFYYNSTSQDISEHSHYKNDALEQGSHYSENWFEVFLKTTLTILLSSSRHFSRNFRIRIYELFYQYFWAEKVNKVLIGKNPFFSVSKICENQNKFYIIVGTHVFWWTKKPHVYWWTQKIIQGPLKDTRFWVHQKKWGFRKGKKSETRVFWVHQKTWGFKRGRVHQKTWGFWVHQKTWGFMRGNTKMGPSKHMRFLVHQMKFCIKFDCANEFFDGGNFSKRGHWGCRGKAPARISKHCLVLGVG